jgi:MYXO-CTERM domain-containing protein
VAVPRDAAGNQGHSLPVTLRRAGVGEVFGRIGCGAGGGSALPLVSVLALGLLAARRRRR